MRKASRDRSPYVRPTLRPAVYVLHLAVLFVSISCCSGDYDDIVNLDSTGTVIVCFGDSITAGEGVGKGEAYPAILSKTLNVDVLNAGMPGNVTLDGLRRLPTAVFQRRPPTVILQFGGNDLNRGYSATQAAENLIVMADCLRQAHPRTNIVIVAPGQVLAEPRLQKMNGVLLVSIDDLLRRYYDPATRHPSKAGQAAIGEMLVQVLRQGGQDSGDIKSAN